MTIWVDADACPNAIKDILFRAAKRTELPLVLVANHYLAVPKSIFIDMRQVEQGFDVADDYIVEQAVLGDLVITGDIPLAADALEKGAQVITSRGEPFNKQNIKQKLNMRDFMETMRSSAVDTRGGPPPFGQKEKQAFANALDRYLATVKQS